MADKKNTYIAVHALVIKDELDDKADAPKHVNPGDEVTISDEKSAADLLAKGAIKTVAQAKADEETEVALAEQQGVVAQAQSEFEANRVAADNAAAGYQPREFSADEMPGGEGIDSGEAGAKSTKTAKTTK